MAVMTQIDFFWVVVTPRSFVVGRRQHGPLKRCYPTTTLQDITTQKTLTFLFYM
jgi:hypothetical protein